MINYSKPFYIIIPSLPGSNPFYSIGKALQIKQILSDKGYIGDATYDKNWSVTHKMIYVTFLVSPDKRYALTQRPILNIQTYSADYFIEHHAHSVPYQPGNHSIELQEFYKAIWQIIEDHDLRYEDNTLTIQVNTVCTDPQNATNTITVKYASKDRTIIQVNDHYNLSTALSECRQQACMYAAKTCGVTSIISGRAAI